MYLPNVGVYGIVSTKRAGMEMATRMTHMAMRKMFAQIVERRFLDRINKIDRIRSGVER